MCLLIEEFWCQVYFEGGYEFFYIFYVVDISFWKILGYFDFYVESMFGLMEVDEWEYQFKLMNCLFYVFIYVSKLCSYWELLICWVEFGMVYCYEWFGVMYGLMWVWGFIQDDVYVFCLLEQISDEILKIFDFIEWIFFFFDFSNYEINFFICFEKFIGDDIVWDLVIKGLIEVLDCKGWVYKIDEGGGVFYGLKIDFKIEDVIGWMWQCFMIQLDFNLLEWFDFDYVVVDGSKQ